MFRSLEFEDAFDSRTMDNAYSLYVICAVSVFLRLVDFAL
jgi:hypothetical protein